MDDPRYDPALDTPPLDDAELEALDNLLQALPGEAVMNVEALDGYLTALVLGPPGLARLSTADWLPAVWGLGSGVDGMAAAGAPGGFAPFASGKQRKRAVQLVLRQLRDIDRRLQGEASRWEPVFSIAETDSGEDLVDAEDWCAGFLQAVPLAPMAWAALFDDAALGPALRPILALGAEDDAATAAPPQDLADPAVRDALSRAVVDGVLALRGRGLPGG